MGLLDKDPTPRFTPKQSKKRYTADNAYKTEEEKLKDLSEL